MPIRVIPLDTIAQPEDFFDAQFVFQLLLDGGAIKSWIAVRIQQATFGGEKSVAAVCVDRASLEDKMLEVEEWQIQGFCDGWRNGVVLVKG